MVIACLIAVGCVVGFVVIWFMAVYRELSGKRRNLSSLKELLLMREEVPAQARDEQDRKISVKMLENNRMVYREAVRAYNRSLKKPVHFLPALLMRFHAADESGGVDYSEAK